MRVWVGGLAVTLAVSGWSGAQSLQARPATPAANANAAPAPVTVDLTVPAGTPLKVAIDHDVRIRRVGEQVRGRTVEPIYAFDKLVVPAGAEVTGKIRAIAPVTKKTRILSALNADLSPQHDVTIEFDRLQLADGRVLPLHTTVTRSEGGVLELVTAPPRQGKAAEGKGLIAKRLAEARQQARRDWGMARSEITAPGKLHRVERYAFRQLPYRPQYLDAGTTFNAELDEPLRFGSEEVMPQQLTRVGSQPPAGSVVHAVLETALSSAENNKGDAVEAVLTRPLFDGPQLILPQGARLEGEVLQARRAGPFKHNGLLRIVFHRVVLPSGMAEKVAASLEAVAAPQGEHLVLDSEGGAQVTTPRTRYLGTALTVALAGMSSYDHDAGVDRGTDSGRSAVGGAVGFRALGIIMGRVVQSRTFTSGMAYYGVGMSVYDHFLSRGHDVVYPKDMSMVIGMGAARDIRH